MNHVPYCMPQVWAHFPAHGSNTTILIDNEARKFTDAPANGLLVRVAGCVDRRHILLAVKLQAARGGWMHRRPHSAQARTDTSVWGWYVCASKWWPPVVEYHLTVMHHVSLDRCQILVLQTCAFSRRGHCTACWVTYWRWAGPLLFVLVNHRDFLLGQCICCLGNSCGAWARPGCTPCSRPITLIYIVCLGTWPARFLINWPTKYQLTSSDPPPKRSVT